MTRTSSILLALLAILLVAGISAYVILFPQGKVAEAVGPAGAPTRLVVPTLSIDAHVEAVGVTAYGAMASPSNFLNVAWFKKGPLPGEVGSAVIAGHVDNALSLSGVFKNLKQLKAGDVVSVFDDNGNEQVFEVLRIEQYAYDAVPEEEVFGNTGGAFLNLITCAGVWLPEKRTYDKRVIVYTQLVE